MQIQDRSEFTRPGRIDGKPGTVECVRDEGSSIGCGSILVKFDVPTRPEPGYPTPTTHFWFDAKDLKVL